MAVQPKRPVLAFLKTGVRNQRRPDLRVAREIQARRHHAHDGRRHFVEPHHPPDYRWVLAIAVLPNLVAQNRHCGSARLFIGGKKVAAEHRLLPDQRERVCGDARAAIHLRRSRPIAQIGRILCARAHRVEGLHLGGDVAVIRKGRSEPSGVRRVLRDDVENLIAMGERQVLEQHGVGQGENRGINANAKRQGGHGDRRESRTFRQRPQAEAHVLKDAHAYRQRVPVRIVPGIVPAGSPPE